MVMKQIGDSISSLSVINNKLGINSTRLPEVSSKAILGTPLTREHYKKTIDFVNVCFDCNPNTPKLTALFALMVEEGFTNEMIDEAAKTLVKTTKRYGKDWEWDIADWFIEFEKNLHDYDWYMKQISKGSGEQVKCYKIKDNIYYTFDIIPGCVNMFEKKSDQTNPDENWETKTIEEIIKNKEK